MKRSLSLALAALLLSGCAAGASGTSAQSTAPASTPTATEVPAEAPTLRWIGNTNSQGYYGTAYDTGETLWGYRIDYDTAEMVRVGDDLSCPTANLKVLADEDALYWTWSGMIDTTPFLLKSDLDGNDREAVYTFPQGTSLPVTGMAADENSLYFRYCVISDEPTRRDDYSLVRLDLQAGTLETLTTWDDLGGDLVGVWGSKLLITRAALDGSCSVEPVIQNYRVDNWNELQPWITATLYALDPATGEETPLYAQREAPGPGIYDRKLAEDALWCVDDQNRLLRRPLGSDTDEVVATLPDAMLVASVYDTDIFLYGQDEDDQSALYLYDRTADEVHAVALQGWFKDQFSPVMVLSQAQPGEYLVLTSNTPVERTLLGTGGLPYTVQATEPNCALATRAELLDTSADLRQVTLPDWEWSML